jgi:archaellum component FlaC
MQDMKEGINKDIKILKNNLFEMSWSISQIKTSSESLTYRMEQVDNKVSEMEDIVEELDQSVKHHEKMLRKYKWDMQDLWYMIKSSSL